MLMLLLFFITVILCVILSFLKQFSKHKDHPPGPSRISLIAGRLSERTFLSEKTLMELAIQYGNIYSLWGGNYYIIVFSGYQTVKEALTKHAEAFDDRPVTPFILTVTKNRGQPFDPSMYIIHFVGNVICAVVFGHCFSTEDKDFLELIESMHSISKFLISFSHIIYEIFPFIMRYLPGSQQKALSAVENIVAIIKKEITHHKEYQNLHEPQDFIDYYLLQMEKSKNDPNSTFDEDNLTHCIADIFLAATDITSGVLQWAMLLMANHLDIQDKVYKEIEKVLDPSHSICYADRKNLPYTNAVIHEVIRSKYITFFGVPRKCVKDVYFNGFLIPKGAMIFPDLRSVLLDPEQWETPEKFNPNHFLDKEGHFVTKEAFMPFGAGGRMCLGELFARIQYFIMFTSLLRAFRLQPSEGVEKLSEEPVIGVTLHPSPFKICAVPRSGTP